ncbi:MAG: alkaline phosphatase D [Bradymonadia bacterium]
MNRRDILKAGASAAALLVLPRRAPAVIAADRPRAQWGVASGDVTDAGAAIWSRTDRPSKMNVEWSLDPTFKSRVRPAGFAHALPETDFCAQHRLTGLPAGREVFYRTTFENLITRARSQPQIGSLRTPSRSPDKAVRFAWSGDVGGQGYGINPKIGGMKIFEAMRAKKPDFFCHCGDMIYADSVFRATKGAQGKRWHNLMTPAKAKVAEEQHEFWGNFRYNLLDENVRRFNADVPLVVQWDDHETKNNWWPGRVLNEDTRYTVKSCDLLAARGKKAFFDYNPIAVSEGHQGRIYRKISYGPLLDVFVLDARSFRAPNNKNQQTRLGPETAFFGGQQLKWLAQGLSRSQATWKVVLCDQPISLLIASGRYTFEGIANGSGAPKGRELEVAWLLKSMKRRDVRNVVWLTADVHYAAAHHYHPDRAKQFKDFDPFWEFVTGPLNAATFGPNRLDRTFGPKVDWHSIPDGMPFGASPLRGLQFFGMVNIDPRSQRFTVTQHGIDGRELYQKTIDPRG